MQRYVILAWAASDVQQSAAARLLATLLQSTSQEWLRGLDRSGLIVLHAGARRGRDDIYVLAGAAGIVLGRLFSRSLDPAPKPVPVRFDDREPSGILGRYWGRYVAVVYDEGRETVRVLRDPSGALPCFHTLYHHVHVFFSDVEDLLPLHLFAFSVDWKHIARTVALSVAHVRSTGLAQVAEVQAGECIEVRSGSLTRSQLWNPCVIAKAHPIEDPDAAAAQLATTVAACVHAWASGHESILHNLSGGLDSSIVLACLASADPRPKITCLNYFSPDREADERRYARLVAGAARCELIEHELDARAVRLDLVLQIARSAKPWFYLYDIEHSAFEARLAAEHGATALFSGAGGDSVFYLGRTELAAVDFARRHGLRPRLIRVAHDAARIERTTVWRVLRAAVRARASAGAAWHPLADVARTRTLVNPEVLDSLRQDPEAVHPWLQLADDEVPAGKLWHMLSMGTPLPYYDTFGRRDAPERILPLMSQPVVELCLRIPTYVLIRGGRNRALARRAFANELPPEIIGRRGKGGSDAHVRRILEANIDFVRELLLDGMLVKRHILNRAKLEAFLADRTQEGPAYNEVVQDYVSIEAWIARWSATTPSAAAG